MPQIKIDKTISIGAILQALILALVAVILSSNIGKSQENDLLIAQSIISRLDDNNAYLVSIVDSMGEVGYGDETAIDALNEIKDSNEEIKKIIDEVKDSVGDASYGDTVVEALRKIRMANN